MDTKTPENEVETEGPRDKRKRGLEMGIEESRTQEEVGWGLFSQSNGNGGENPDKKPQSGRAAAEKNETMLTVMVGHSIWKRMSLVKR